MHYSARWQLHISVGLVCVPVCFCVNVPWCSKCSCRWQVVAYISLQQWCRSHVSWWTWLYTVYFCCFAFTFWLCITDIYLTAQRGRCQIIVGSVLSPVTYVNLSWKTHQRQCDVKARKPQFSIDHKVSKYKHRHESRTRDNNIPLKPSRQSTWSGGRRGPGKGKCQCCHTKMMA